MADRVTCCPNCSTSFRITDAQLQTAKGAVRCGSCLQIFRALDHLIPLPTAADTPVMTPSTPELAHEPAATHDTVVDPGVSAPRDFDDNPLELGSNDPVAFDHTLFDNAFDDDDRLIDDNSLIDDDPHEDDDLDLDEDLLISDDMGQEPRAQSFSLGELSNDFLGSDATGKVKSSLFDRELKVREVESDHSDESWAEELLQEIESEEAAEQHARPASDIFKSFADLDAATLEHTTNNDSMFELAEDVERYDRITTGSFDDDIEEVDAELGESFPSYKEPLFSITDELDSEPLEEAPVSPSSVDDEPAPTTTRAASEHDLLLQGIAPAPVEMHWHHESSPWPKRLLWGGLSLLAGLVIIAQLAYFNFDQYSRTEPWRGIYATLCPVVGCSLPSLSDPRQVKTYNLVVRSSPHADNALIIDSIMLNTANFDQPFPDFALTFTNLQGKPLAHRRFKPQEYLGGEMAGINRMPSGQPVHISLEIVDPGTAAVNYTATIPLD